MIILDKPYISNFLIETIKNNKLPVLANSYSNLYEKDINPYLHSEEKFISEAQKTKNLKIYTTSENSIGWILKNLGFINLPKKIDLFKNKTKFRKLISSIYPDFYFKEIQVDKINELSVDELPFPFIIKPSTGFFSMGVYKVNNQTEWEQTKKNILIEIKKVKNLYPTEVLNTNTFIIEEYIEGKEFAFDAYFNEFGNPVILNIFEHYFASSNDVSDRIYFTSKKIIKENLQVFTEFLNKIGNLAQVKNFPVHVEVRLNGEGKPIPIEINPLRFGGWCTTADLTFHAYGYNPYVYFFNSKKPDWDSILAKTNDNLFSIIALNNSTGVDAQIIKSFDYNLLCSSFSNVLEIRKINFKEYPVFGFLYTETSNEFFSELEKISTSSLKEYIHI